MPIFSRISESHARNWVQNLASKGWGAEKIYRHIRDFLKIGFGERSDVPRSFVRRESVPLRRAVLTQQRSFPTHGNTLLNTKRAIQINATSTLGNRFHINFQFRVTNPITGKTEIINNTIGSPRVLSLSEARELAKSRVERWNAREFLNYGNFYQPMHQQDYLADPSSIQFVNVFELIGG